jgi:hypothetical protein
MAEIIEDFELLDSAMNGEFEPEKVDFNEVSAQGYPVVKLYPSGTVAATDQPIAILNRPNYGDYVVAWGYDPSDGTWGQGHYNFDSEDEANAFVDERYGITYDSDKETLDEFVGRRTNADIAGKGDITETNKNPNPNALGLADKKRNASADKTKENAEKIILQLIKGRGGISYDNAESYLFIEKGYNKDVIREAFKDAESSGKIIKDGNLYRRGKVTAAMSENDADDIRMVMDRIRGANRDLTVAEMHKVIQEETGRSGGEISDLIGKLRDEGYIEILTNSVGTKRFKVNASKGGVSAKLNENEILREAANKLLRVAKQYAKDGQDEVDIDFDEMQDTIVFMNIVRELQKLGAIWPHKGGIDWTTSISKLTAFRDSRKANAQTVQAGFHDLGYYEQEAIIDGLRTLLNIPVKYRRTEEWLKKKGFAKYEGSINGLISSLKDRGIADELYEWLGGDEAVEESEKGVNASNKVQAGYIPQHGMKVKNDGKGLREALGLDTLRHIGNYTFKGTKDGKEYTITTTPVDFNAYESEYIRINDMTPTGEVGAGQDPNAKNWIVVMPMDDEPDAYYSESSNMNVFDKNKATHYTRDEALDLVRNLKKSGYEDVHSISHTENVNAAANTDEAINDMPRGKYAAPRKYSNEQLKDIAREAAEAFYDSGKDSISTVVAVKNIGYDWNKFNIDEKSTLGAAFDEYLDKMADEVLRGTREDKTKVGAAKED